MRYAIYALLVLFGIGGVVVGLSFFGDPRSQGQGFICTLIGVAALGSLAVVMAIEHIGADVRELRRLLVQQEKRAQAIDAQRAQPPPVVVPQARPGTER